MIRLFLILFFFFAPPVLATTPTNDLVASWQLNAKTFSTPADQMTVSDSAIPAGNNPVSISIRFKTAASYNINNYGVAFFYGTKATGRGVYLGVGYDANIPQNSFFVGPHSDALGMGVAVNDNNWHRATATFNGTTWKLYLDGVLKGTKNMSTNIVKTGSAKIGGADGFYWNGSLDTIYVWNRELSEIEVGQISDVYKIKAGETITLPSPCVFGNTQPVTINSGLVDGGTIRTISFDCEGVQKEVRVVIFRDFSQLIKFPSNGVPAIPFNTQNWNKHGQDTVYFTEDLKYNGKYFALSNSNDSSLGPWDKLTLYSSTDLLNWSAEPNNPVIAPTIGGWDEVYLLHPAVIKVGNLWYAYYSAYGYGARNYWNNNPGDSRLGVEHIGFATSENLVNWTKNPQPVLGNAAAHAALPSIVKLPTGYRMYYYDRLNNNSRYAESADGINWTDKGVFFPKQLGDWDFNFSLNNFDPWVIKNPKGFYEMTYSVLYPTGSFVAGWTQDIGYAVSEDGINWYKYQGAIMSGTKRIGDFDQWYIGNPMLYFANNKIYSVVVSPDVFS